MLKPNIQYALLVQQGNLVFVKIGGQFADWLGQEHLEGRAEIAQGMAVQDLLGLDKDNFQVAQEEVSNIEVRKTRYSWRTTYAGGGVVKINGRVKELLEIVPGQDVEKCAELLSQGLPGKVDFKKYGHGGGLTPSFMGEMPFSPQEPFR